MEWFLWSVWWGKIFLQEFSGTVDVLGVKGIKYGMKYFLHHQIVSNHKFLVIHTRGIRISRVGIGVAGVGVERGKKEAEYYQDDCHSMICF